jgi:hypothetical protein
MGLKTLPCSLAIHDLGHGKTLKTWYLEILGTSVKFEFGELGFEKLEEFGDN